VDASVGIKLFLPEPHFQEAQTLFEGLAKDPPCQLFVPDLFHVECANILWKYVQRYGYPASEAKRNVVALNKLELRVIPIQGVMDVVLDLALRLGITAYDASYVVLAHRMGAPLVTADERLARRLKKEKIPVKWIGEVKVDEN
jgi:predicted nucleic acid-binding protein